MGELDIPKVNALDAGRSLIKVKLNLIPNIGGALAEAFDFLTPSPIEKRKIEWMQNVVTAIEQLEVINGEIMNRISDNEEFISLFISTSNKAFNTHLIEKHIQLRNVLMNSINGENTFDINQIYIKFIEELSVSQIEILRIINENYSSITDVNEYEKIYHIILNLVNPSIKESFEMEITIFRFLINDLIRKGLIFTSTEIKELNSDSGRVFNDEIQKHYVPLFKLTQFGVNFLKTIESDYL